MALFAFEILKTILCIAGSILAVAFLHFLINALNDLIKGMRGGLIDSNTLRSRVDSLVHMHTSAENYMNCITDIRRIIDDLSKS